ncbi:MAG: rhomboid family intramembrane serine protease [Leptospiraceae bacterium]|nr:rhomboid family intramembrane serine protease [Leptospiraceae bacterium]
MAKGGNEYRYQVRLGPEFTPMVKILVIICSGIFVIQSVLHLMGIHWIEAIFALNSNKVSSGHVYQLFTYAFIHADIWHILFNMLNLWVFGSELENYLGKKSFLYFYLFSAFFAGLFTWLVEITIWKQTGITLGASGAVFACMTMFGLVWKNRELLFMMIIPIKAKYLVPIVMGVSILFFQNSNISHITHLGGVIFGLTYYFLMSKYRFSFESFFDLDDYLRRRKFKMYQEEMENRINVKQKVDELLEKISKNGIGSLTRKERNFLNEASTKYYTEDK